MYAVVSIEVSFLWFCLTLSVCCSLSRSLLLMVLFLCLRMYAVVKSLSNGFVMISSVWGKNAMIYEYAIAYTLLKTRQQASKSRIHTLVARDGGRFPSAIIFSHYSLHMRGQKISGINVPIRAVCEYIYLILTYSQPIEMILQFFSLKQLKYYCTGVC